MKRTRIAIAGGVQLFRDERPKPEPPMPGKPDPLSPEPVPPEKPPPDIVPAPKPDERPGSVFQ